MRIAVKFAYNGKNYSGYARQPGQRTVEQDVLDFLMEQGVFQDAKTACFRTASRTDRGVSALGNVCAFDTTVSKDDLLRLLCTHALEVFFYGVQEVIPGFYPRHAIQRQYRYYLRDQTIDIEKVLQAAALFTGEHNFQNFARVEPLKNPVRSIDAIIISKIADFLVLDFYAQTFLWNQIRRIVSALKKAGMGILSLDEIRHALGHPEQRVDLQMVAPEPLLLTDVMYEFSFDCIKGYKKRLVSFERNILSSLP